MLSVSGCTFSQNYAPNNVRAVWAVPPHVSLCCLVMSVTGKENVQGVQGWGRIVALTTSCLHRVRSRVLAAQLLQLVVPSNHPGPSVPATKPQTFSPPAGSALGSAPVSASCISVVDPGPGVRLEVRNSTFRGNGLVSYNATGERSVRSPIAVRCSSTAALGRGMACSTRLEGVEFDGNSGVLASAAFQWCRYANCTFQLVGVTVRAGGAWAWEHV